MSLVPCSTESCSRRVRTCSMCASEFPNNTALCDVCWKAAGSLCVVCKTSPAQNERIYQHRCKLCFGKQSPAVLAQLVRGESDQFLASVPSPQTLDVRAPALQSLLGPADVESGSLPEYGRQPEYLDPNHCRLCLAPVGSSDNDLRAHVVAEHSELRGLSKDVLHAYRQTALGKAWADWPTPISPQVLRSRLAAFKAEMIDENYAMAACAVCCRQKRRCKLRRACFPSSSP